MRRRSITGLALIFAVVLAGSFITAIESTPVVGDPVVLTVTQTYFPASKCTQKTQSDCDNQNRYNATFNLTYTVGGNNLSGGLKVVFGYAEINKTTGFYAYYSRFFGSDSAGAAKISWAEPMLQNASSSSLNYVTVSTTNDSVGADIIYITDDGLTLTVNNTLAEGDNVTIEFHNISQPGIAVETDLMVLEDTNGDGMYQHVVEIYSDISEYPKLIVTGWNLTRFDVIAPSRTNGSEFNITVRAVDERSGLYEKKFTPAYIIRNYTGTISFSSSDSNAILPPDYTFTLADRGTHTFNVTLSTTGIQNVTASSSTITGTSNPISVNDSDYDNYKIYWWGGHIHTFMSGHSVHGPTYSYLYARDDAALDVISLSEHCNHKTFNWTYQRDLYQDYYDPGKFVPLLEYEYTPYYTPISRPEEGHRNILFKNASGRDVFCESGVSPDPAVKGGKTLKQIADHYANDDVFAIYHHSLMKWQRKFRWQNASDVNETKLHKFIEIYSWHGSSEYQNNSLVLNNNSDAQISASYESSAQEGIAKGYVLGIIAGTDNHFGKAGSPGAAFSRDNDDGYAFKYARNGLTAIYAKNLTYDGIWEALDNRRTYGTTDARTILEFETNKGHMMGSAGIFMNNITLTVRVVGTDTIDTIAIMRNGTEQVYGYSGSSFDESFSWTDTNVGDLNTYSYYVWFNQTDGVTYGWSSPIWITKVPYTIVANNALTTEEVLTWTKNRKSFSLSCPAGTQLNFTINDTRWNDGDKIVAYHNNVYDGVSTVSDGSIKYSGTDCSTWAFEVSLFNIIDSPANTTYTRNYSIDLNTSYTTEVNVTYSWDGEGNISGCRNCTFYNTTYGESVPEANTSLLLHFNENFGGTAYDDSANGNDASLGNATAGTEPIWTTRGRFGPALEFDGTDDEMEVPYSDSLNITKELTVMFWFRLDGSNAVDKNQYLVSQGLAAYTNYRWAVIFNKNTGSMRWWVCTVAGSCDNSAFSMIATPDNTIQFSRWYFAALTYNSSDGSMSLYINGTLRGTKLHGVGGDIKNDASDPVQIGERFQENKLHPNGTIDEVHILNRVLNASEIANVYNKTLLNGSHNVTVYASDTAGNMQSSTVRFIINKYSISLNQGWNLISIPLEQDNWSVEAVLTSIEGNYSVVYAYIDGVWKFTTSRNPLTVMDLEHGYWINMTAPDTLEINGTVPSATTITVNPEWNLVGYPSLATREITTVLSAINYTSVYVYIDGSWKFTTSRNPLTEMTSGYGYWIDANEAGSYEVGN